MVKNDRQGSDPDPTLPSDNVGNFIPYNEIDKSTHDIIHPENAQAILGMTARTAYRKMDSGELEYTTDRGAKRIVVKKDQTFSHSYVRQIHKIASDESDNSTVNDPTTASFEKILDRFPNFQSLLEDKESQLKTLQDNYNQLVFEHQHNLERLRNDYSVQIDSLRRLLEEERIKNARLDGEISKIDSVDAVISAQKETIASQKTTIESLNNERIVITHQLQKWRSSDNDRFSSDTNSKSPFWKFWR